MSSKLQSTQQDNAATMAKIHAQRAEIEQLLSGLEWVIKDIEGTVDAMYTNGQSGFNELKSDVWQMEQEVAASR
jgi:kinetochore protein NNF1